MMVGCMQLNYSCGLNLAASRIIVKAIFSTDTANHIFANYHQKVVEH